MRRLLAASIALMLPLAALVAGQQTAVLDVQNMTCGLCPITVKKSLALSRPPVIAVYFERARNALDWLAELSRRVPRWTGMLLIGLGAWSIWFALFVSIAP
jgi:hypothetical protein